MDTTPHTIDLEIFGEPYTVRSDLPPEDLKELGVLVNDLMIHFQKQHPAMTPTQIAVMTALNFCEELLHLRRYNSDNPEINQRLEAVNKKITDVLATET